MIILAFVMSSLCLFVWDSVDRIQVWKDNHVPFILKN